MDIENTPCKIKCCKTPYACATRYQCAHHREDAAAAEHTSRKKALDAELTRIWGSDGAGRLRSG